MQRDREARAHGHAVDRGDDHLVAVHHRVDELLGLLHQRDDRLEALLRGQQRPRFEVIEVAAGGEGAFASARHDCNLHRRVAVDVGPDSASARGA